MSAWGPSCYSGFGQELFSFANDLSSDLYDKHGEAVSFMDIACFGGGMLDPEERDEIMLHLTYCDTCRREWLTNT